MTTMTISQLARRSGVPATTLRFYEKAGVLPQPPRTPAGYRRYDEAALARVAFLQRAKALGVELDDIAQLVKLWDGDRCEPVQDRLRASVHQQRLATRQRLDELTQLARDLEQVASGIDATDACGPGCACLATPVDTPAAPLPLAVDDVIGAACTLDPAEVPGRLRAWRELRERATSVEDLPGGIRLTLEPGESLDEITSLVTAESACCSFYRFTLTVDGQVRSLAIEAAPEAQPAIGALLGLHR